MLRLERICSLFPSTVVENPDDWTVLNSEAVFQVKKRHLKDVDFSKYCRAFVPFLQPVSQTVVGKVLQETPQTKPHLIYTFNACKTEECRDIEDIRWETVVNKYSRPLVVRKKSCNLQCFQRNTTFLVKCYFTFGLTFVYPSQVHIIQTLNKPILFYITRRNMSKKPPFSFKASYQNSFDCYVLKPNKNYLVPTRVTYILMTTQKTLFKIDVCEVNVAQRLRYEYQIKFSNPLGCSLNRWRSMTRVTRVATAVQPIDSLEDEEQRSWNLDVPSVSQFMIMPVPELLDEYLKQECLPMDDETEKFNNVDEFFSGFFNNPEMLCG